MDAGLLTSLLQGASSIFGGLTDQSGYKKVSNYDKAQKGIYNKIGNSLNQGQGYDRAMGLLQGYLDPNSSVYQNFEAPYLNQFNEQIVPQLAERFAGLGANSGALSSSGFAQALGGAGAGLTANLAGLKANLQRSSIQDILGQYQNFLANQPFSYVDQTPGMLSNVFTKLGSLPNPYGAPNLGKGSSSANLGQGNAPSPTANTAPSLITRPQNQFNPLGVFNGSVR
jgi:hypothetical protein